MEINAVSAAPERPCSQGGTAAGTPASGAFLALLMQFLGIAGEGPVAPDPGGGNPVWNPGEAGTPGTPAGVFQTVPAEKLPLSPPGDAGIMEPLLPPAGIVEGPGELEGGGGREQFTGRQEVLLAALMNFCGMMENNLPAAVPGADPGGGDGNSPAAAPLSRLLETAGYLPVPLPEAAPGDGQAGQHMDAAIVELKGPALPELLQDETQSYDAFLKERILQLLRGSGILEPGRGSRAVDSQQPGVPENLGEVVVHLVYRQGDMSAHFLAGNPAAGEAIESALPRLREALVAQNLHLQNASVLVGEESGSLCTDHNFVQGKSLPAFGQVTANTDFKNARVPVEVVSQEAIPEGGLNGLNTVQGEVLNNGNNEISRQIAQDTISPLATRFDSVETPDLNLVHYLSTAQSGEGKIETSVNLSVPIIYRENVSPLQMPALIVRVLRQAVARHIEGQTHLWFKLEPEHLGEVMVRLVYRHGDVSAHFLASNAAAGDAIESALPHLREALATQNLHLQNASVSVGEEGGNPRPDYNIVHGKAVPAFDHGAANLEFKNARVPVDVVPQSTIPGGKPDSDIVEAPNTRGGVVSRQIAQDTTSPPLMNRNDSAGTPGHNPAQYQSTNHSGDGITGTSNNLSNPIIQRENVNLLQMPALIGRVLRQAVARHIEGQTHLWFKLEPEHLGEVMVRLVYRHGDVSAHFLASNAAAGDAIESALPQLREALAAQNLHLHSASVSVGHEGGLPPRSDYQQPGYNYGRQHSGPGVDPEGSTWQEQPADPLPGGINLFV
jgi:flagellar hook-length control protein FliK